MKKLTSLTSLLLLTVTSLFAQETPKKLKDVQANNLFAPSPVKIDGKLNDWNDEFQAYNKSTHLYYTIANDEKNLYLVVKTSDMTTKAKIVAGGLTLAINTADKKKEQDAYSLTYPLRSTMGRPGGGGGAPGGAQGGGMRLMTFGGPGGGGRPAAPDSAMQKAMQDRVINAAKEIKVFGFKDIPDSLIAIYNEYNIKAAINYDKDGAFIYELAVPLKLMALAAGDSKEIAYNIKLNGLQLNFRMMSDNGGGPPPGGGDGPGGGGGMRMMTFGGPGGPGGGGKNSIDFQDLISPNDFWGKYTLAKK
ncbi:hypothetical protein [Mucilaginibacter sp. UYCu711]|uniref:hypothetical protein n=1 Tax=Mucilaginibacter sp. UYCu711 TaxID=3156339 RepID=UPI003D23B58B